jgi:hypothetical protein
MVFNDHPILNVNLLTISHCIDERVLNGVGWAPLVIITMQSAH